MVTSVKRLLVPGTLALRAVHRPLAMSGQKPVKAAGPRAVPLANLVEETPFQNWTIISWLEPESRFFRLLSSSILAFLIDTSAALSLRGHIFISSYQIK